MTYSAEKVRGMVAMLSTAGDLSHASRCKLLSETCELLTSAAAMLEQHEAVTVENEMKEKLRKLAGMVREAYRAGFIAACKWPEPVSQDVDSSVYNKEFNDWSFSVREKHAAILDAEGDGVAVDFSNDVIIDRGALQMALNVLRRSLKNEVADELVAACKPLSRPARSGEVSHE